MTEASLISSGNQNPPLFRGSAGSLDAASNGLFPIAKSKNVEGFAASFSSCLMRINESVRLVGVGYIGDIR